MPFSRLFRFSLGMYSRDVTTKADNATARAAFSAGVLSTFLNVIGLVLKAPMLFLAAVIVGVFSVGLGIAGLGRRAKLLTTKYVRLPEAGFLRLGKNRACFYILLGVVGIWLGGCFY